MKIIRKREMVNFSPWVETRSWPNPSPQNRERGLGFSMGWGWGWGVPAARPNLVANLDTVTVGVLYDGTFFSYFYLSGEIAFSGPLLSLWIIFLVCVCFVYCFLLQGSLRTCITLLLKLYLQFGYLSSFLIMDLLFSIY